jgi:tetratricopeptide (TPR) repeat protein
MSADRTEQLIEAALWLRLSGDSDGARRLLEQALKLDPDNARARQQLQETGLPPLPIPRTITNPFIRVDSPATAAAPEQLQDWGAETSRTLTPDASSAWDSAANPGVHLRSVPPAQRAALDLIEADSQSPGPLTSAVRNEVQTLLQGAEDLLGLDDHSGAMDLLLKARELAPGEPQVQALIERSEHTLMAMLESKLGDLGRVPKVRLKDDEIIWLNLDHRAGFMLAQIDGTVSYDDLFALSGMSRLDTARILAQLLEEGVITS